jgi:hypothetical protein
LKESRKKKLKITQRKIETFFSPKENGNVLSSEVNQKSFLRKFLFGEISTLNKVKKLSEIDILFGSLHKTNNILQITDWMEKFHDLEKLNVNQDELLWK